MCGPERTLAMCGQFTNGPTNLTISSRPCECEIPLRSRNRSVAQRRCNGISRQERQSQRSARH
jgi:hypothetical protein